MGPQRRLPEIGSGERSGRTSPLSPQRRRLAWWLALARRQGLRPAPPQLSNPMYRQSVRIRLRRWRSVSAAPRPRSAPSIERLAARVGQASRYRRRPPARRAGLPASSPAPSSITTQAQLLATSSTALVNSRALAERAEGLGLGSSMTPLARCRACGDLARLVVHHRNGHNEKRGLITLCIGCHTRVHRYRALPGVGYRKSCSNCGPRGIPASRFSSSYISRWQPALLTTKSRIQG